MAKTVAERREIVEEYLRRVASGTAAEILELYGDNPTLEDPVGSEVRSGREAIEEFYRTLEAMDSTTELREFRASGDHAAAFAFDVRTRTGDTTVEVSVIEVMEFDDEGRITHMRAYWHPDADMTMS